MFIAYKNTAWKSLSGFVQKVLWPLLTFESPNPRAVPQWGSWDMSGPCPGLWSIAMLEPQHEKTCVSFPLLSHQDQHWLWDNGAVNLCFPLFNCQLLSLYESYFQAFNKHSWNVLKKGKTKQNPNNNCIFPVVSCFWWRELMNIKHRKMWYDSGSWGFWKSDPSSGVCDLYHSTH